MFHPDFHFKAPAVGRLLVEVGVDHRAVRDVAKDKRAIRRLDCVGAYPEYNFPNLSLEPEFRHALHEEVPAELYGLA